MSDSETEDNDNESLDLLNDEPINCVPETQTDTEKYSESQNQIVNNGYCRVDHKHISNKGSRLRNTTKTKQRTKSSDIKGYDHCSRHNKGNSSIARKKSRRQMFIPFPDELTTNQDRYDCIMSIFSNLKEYFPSIDNTSDTQKNINALLNHAKHAYKTLEIEHDQLEEADYKIREMEEKLKNMEKEFESKRVAHSTKRNLDALVIEIEEDLMVVICDLIWFVLADNINETDTSLYNPRVGESDYNSVLGTICFHYIFNKSKKFARKIKKELPKIDMQKEQSKWKVWKYIWQKPAFGKNISTELNSKRSMFVFMAKSALEIIMTSKNKKYSDKLLLEIIIWISNPDCSSDSFNVLKNTLFVIIAAVKTKKTNIHHNNIKSVIHDKQDNDGNTLYFVEDIVKVFDGVKIMDTISINDIALTCVALINCVEIYILKNNEDLTEITIDSEDNSIRSGTSGNDTSSLSLSQSQSLDDGTIISKGNTWNCHMRNKPKNYDYVYGLDEYSKIKEHIGKNQELYLFTGAKKFSGGYTGSGHGWLMKGVQKYEAIRQNLMLQKTFLMDCIFECNQMTEETLVLTDILNMDETENLQNDSLTDVVINDILASGKLTCV